MTAVADSSTIARQHVKGLDMHTVHLRVAVALLVLTVLFGTGCEPSTPSGGANVVPPSPPPPPGAAASPAGTPSAAAAPVAAAGSLPGDLVQKIDALIQSHKDYNAVAAQVQDQQTAKDRFEELSAITQRSSDAHDEVMIGTKQLSLAQRVEFEAYMNQRVTPVWDLRKQHQSRLEALLGQ
jgi:hypothetical protein